MNGKARRNSNQSNVRSKKQVGMVPSISDCASACKGLSSMFAFGTNDYGNALCSNLKCQCLCETSASPGGKCTKVRHTGYHLYKYRTGDYGEYATRVWGRLALLGSGKYVFVLKFKEPTLPPGFAGYV